MNKMSMVIGMIMMFCILALPGLAHETQNFEIGDTTYALTVGSLNEPVYVDDKSGVEFIVKELAPVEEHEEEGHDESLPHTHEAETDEAVTGLENTLKVEVSAGGKKKIFDLKPAWGEPGSYSAPFYPTVETTYTYRFFGSINDIPVDLTFTCNPAGHPKSVDDTSEVQVSSGVTRVLKRGAFGCPQSRAAVSFPESTQGALEMGRALDETASQASTTASESSTAFTLGVVALVVALAALLAALVSLRKK